MSWWEYQNINARHGDFNNIFEIILTMKIRLWIINLFDEMEVANVVLQEQLLDLINEELKVKLRKFYQKFWLHPENLFEIILTMKIPLWSINLFDEIEVANVVLQEELLELTNEELKVKLKKCSAGVQSKNLH